MSLASRTILRGGRIIDGTGAAAFPGEIVVANGLIVSVLPGEAARTSVPAEEAEVVDCSGLVIAPGFIDAHSHSDLKILENRTEKLLQGVTTEVVGNCGFSAYPAPEDPQRLREFANGILCGDDRWGWASASEYLESAAKSRVATAVSLAGHGSLRIRVAGNTTRALTGREMDSMRGLLQDALEQGAAGFSSGLMYAPGSGASPEELIALCRVVARRGGVYATHMRSYSASLMQAVEEQIAIAEASGCRLQISHLQAAGEEYWPLQPRALAAIEAASVRGVDVAFDAYPWLAGSTVLTQLLPQSALDGGMPRLLARLTNPQERERIAPLIKGEAHWDRVVITSVAFNEAFLVGKSVQEIAERRGTDPQNVVMDLLVEQQGNVNIVEHCQSIDNLRALLTHPLGIVITDGVYTRGRSHPRLYGTFPLLLGHFVRERKWLSPEEAVHKVTGRPAAVFNLGDRGRIAEGCVADLTIFDPDAIRTDAAYERPDVPPVGIQSVWRSGRRIVNAGQVAA